MKFRLPYNQWLVPDLRTAELIRMCLAEDWAAQQLFTLIDKQGYMADEQVPRMRRHLHVLRVLETEIRMRKQARGLYE